MHVCKKCSDDCNQFLYFHHPSVLHAIRIYNHIYETIGAWRSAITKPLWLYKFGYNVKASITAHALSSCIFSKLKLIQ